MITHRCDNCKKVIKFQKILELNHAFTRLDLCQACAKPILRLLDSQQLLKPRLVKKLVADPFEAGKN